MIGAGISKNSLASAPGARILRPMADTPSQTTGAESWLATAWRIALTLVWHGASAALVVSSIWVFSRLYPTLLDIDDQALLFERFPPRDLFHAMYAGVVIVFACYVLIDVVRTIKTSRIGGSGVERVE